MNKLKRTLALVATLASSATAFVGCGDDSSSSTTSITFWRVVPPRLVRCPLGASVGNMP